MLYNYSNIHLRKLAHTALIPVLMMFFGGLAWATLASRSENLSNHSYDKNTDRIYQVQWKTISRMNVADTKTYTPFPLAALMRSEMEGLETIAQIQLFGKGFLKATNQAAVRLDEIVFASPELVDVFEVKAIEGNLKETLATPNQVALSKSTAKKIFKNINPIGQMLQLNNTIQLQVTSIFEDSTTATYASAQVLISFTSLTEQLLGEFPMDTWTEERKSQLYVVLEEHQNAEELNTQLQSLAHIYLPKHTPLSVEHTFVLKALKDIHQVPKTLLNRFAMN